MNGQVRASKIDRVFAVLAPLVPVLAWCVYSGLLMKGRLRLGPHEGNYFKFLAKSLLHGRLDIHPEGVAWDLIHYHDKLYLYWPPIPAVTLMPLVRWFSPLHDNLVIASFGALNVALFGLVLSRLSKRYHLGLRPVETFCLCVFWAFGTVQWYLTMTAWVWYVSEIMAQTYLLLAVLTLLTGTSPVRLLLSGLFFAATVYTRNNLVFAFFFLAALYYNQHRTHRWVRDAAIFLVPFAVFSALNLAYNAARFDGRMFDNGIAYHDMAERFRPDFQTYGYFSLHYLRHNVYYEVLRPLPLSSQFPFIKGEPEGFGFLWASPVFCLGAPTLFVFAQSLVAWLRGGAHSVEPMATWADTILMGGAALSTLCVGFVIFTIMGTGWVQFGARYTLDFYLMALVFSLFALKFWRGKWLYALGFVLLVWSVYVQYVGTRYMT